jgi:hypothetical protein
MQLVEFCLDRFSNDDMCLMAVLSRRIWLRMKKFIFESTFTPPQVVYQDTVISFEEYRRYNRK